VVEEIQALDRIRLERDLTFAQLASEIGVSLPALYRIMRTPDVRVLDRTRHKIRRYLRSQGIAE
jgi:transcriptional regulator with XRE-family HTH domain